MREGGQDREAIEIEVQRAVVEEEPRGQEQGGGGEGWTAAAGGPRCDAAPPHHPRLASPSPTVSYDSLPTAAYEGEGGGEEGMNTSRYYNGSHY